MAPQRSKTEGEVLEEMQADAMVPWVYSWTKISHYYGDSVRALLIVCAVLMLITAPFYADDIQTELPFIVLGTVAMVFVAGMTSPWKRGVISADAVTSGVGFMIFEIWALSDYRSDLILQFVLREAIAILFLFALYFSTKTLRNMLLNNIGRPDGPRDFLSGVPTTQTEDDLINWKQQAQEALHDLNEHEKLEFGD
jgi:hypothetical protein